MSAMFESRIDHGALSVRVDPTATGPFLVWSHVEEWKTVDIPDEARSLADFEKWLPIAAASVGIDASEPFALLIFGHAESATLHVVDLPEGSVVDHELHDRAKHLVPFFQQPVQLLGFHATDAQGVYTHYTTHLHLHLRTVLGDVMGHVDQLTLAPGSVVKIAVQQRAHSVP